MNCSKIVLLDSFCELDDFRDSSGALTIDVPKSAGVTINKRAEELSDLEKITSDYSNSFDLLLTSREMTILNNIQYQKTSNSKLIYRAYLLDDELVQVDGFLYIEETEERIFDGIVKVKAQIIGTHQSWKEYFRVNRLSSIDLGIIEWNSPNVLNLWQNNDFYQDNSISSIYPLLANFGKKFGTSSASLLDIRFLVYLKALLDAAFCSSGYKIRSEFFNSKYFRRQAFYLLGANFGQSEKIQSGSEVIVESSIDSTIGGGIVPFDTVILDPTSKFDNVLYRYTNNTGQDLYNIFIDLTTTQCNNNALAGASSAIVLIIKDSGGGTILSPIYFIPEMNRAQVGNVLNASECFTASAVIDTGQILRDYAVNSGYIQAGWYIEIGHINAINPTAFVQAGAYARFYTKNSAFFEQGDIFEISKTLNDTFTIYDLLLDIKKMFNLRFKTIESQKIVEIEPEPAVYETYPDLIDSGFQTEGFSGNFLNPNDVIDITDFIDVCQFVKRKFPQQNQSIYYNFKFKDSTDNYSKYKDFGDSNLELFQNDTSNNIPNVIKKDIELKLIEPTLNDFDNELSNIPLISGTYVPYMWENAQAEGSSDLPEAGSNLGVRAFVVFGWQTQVKGFDAIGFIYEGVTYQFVPNVGQLFEIQITTSPTTFGLPLINNVFKDNLSAIEQEKNLVNTFYSQSIEDDLTIVSLSLKGKLSDLFFKCVDVRKLFRIFSQKSSLMKFNGFYQYESISKNISSEELSSLVLKPKKSCDNG